MVDHSLWLEVSELDGEGFEGVALGHVVFDGGLEFFVGEGLATDSLEFVVAESSLEEVAELVVEVGFEVAAIVPAYSLDLIP